MIGRKSDIDKLISKRLRRLTAIHVDDDRSFAYISARIKISCKRWIIGCRRGAFYRDILVLVKGPMTRE